MPLDQTHHVPEIREPFVRESLIANDVGPGKQPPAVVSLVVSTPVPKRILIVKLFSLANEEVSLTSGGTARRSYIPLTHIGVEATSLNASEVKDISNAIEKLNQGKKAPSDVLETRLMAIDCMKESGKWAGRRKLYDPEWSHSWEFSPSEPLTAQNVSSALLNFLTKQKPETPPMK